MTGERVDLKPEYSIPSALQIRSSRVLDGAENLPLFLLQISALSRVGFAAGSSLATSLPSVKHLNVPGFCGETWKS